jgi:hypothetical protein
MGHGEMGERQLTESLPAPDTVRWVASRKATLVRGVQAGLLSLEDACSRYSITVDEFLVWQNRLARHGDRGLRVGAFRDIRNSRRPAVDAVVNLAEGLEGIVSKRRDSRYRSAEA